MPLSYQPLIKPFSSLYSFVKISNRFIIIYALQHKCCIMLPLVLNIFRVFFDSSILVKFFQVIPYFLKIFLIVDFPIFLIRKLLSCSSFSCFQRKMSSFFVFELGEYKLINISSNSRLFILNSSMKNTL